MNRAPGNNAVSRAANRLNSTIKARRAAATTMSNNAGATFATRQTIITIVATLLIVIVLVAAGRWLWRYHRDEQAVAVNTFTLLDGANAGDNEFTIGANQMPPSTYSNEYALSFWVYVDDYNYRRDQDKFIMRRGRFDADGRVNPEIRLHPYHNTLEVAVGLQTTERPGNNGQQHHPECAVSVAAVTGANTSEAFMDRPKYVHPTHDLSESYFAAMDGVQVVPNPEAGKQRGLALARLHQEHSERFQDSPDASTATAVPTEEGSTQTSATTEEECICTCGADSAAAGGKSVMTREDWYKTAVKCQVPNFPLQKWVHVVVSQYNQSLDVFVDGHLASSCPLPGFPAISTDNMVLSPDGGFSGRIARVTYSNTSLSAAEVQAVYQQGPDSNYKPIRQRVPMWAMVVVVLAILLLVALTVI